MYVADRGRPKASWQPPLSEGSSPVTGYHLVLTSEGMVVFTADALPEARTYTFLGPLVPQATYAVSVTAVSSVGSGPDATVSATMPLAALVAVPTPTVSGVAKVGAVLTATAGTWSPTPFLTYQWLVGGAAVTGATSSTFVVPPTALGQTVTVRLTGTLSGFLTTSATSTPTVPVVAGTLSPTPTPTISGTVKVGYRLTANPGTWGPAPVTLRYQWYRSGVAVSGATASTYLLSGADQGKAMTVRVTGSKLGYTSVVRTSAATSRVV